MDATVFVDESGDLGWKFDAPYLRGGSSRYLTIAAVMVPNALVHHPARVIRDLYLDRKWSTAKERKWTGMSPGARINFAQRAVKMCDAHADIRLFAMTVKKCNVQQHLQTDSNLLYNYMLKLLLIDDLVRCSKVTLRPDPRTIKVASGNSQHDYLQTTLYYERNVTTKLFTEPMDSKTDLGIQFADMLAGVVQSHQEFHQSDPWKVLSHKVRWRTLFF